MNEIDLDVKVPESLTEYVDALNAFRRFLEKGCMICGSGMVTRKSKFWFVDWDEWICKGEWECLFSRGWNDIFKTFADLKKQKGAETSDKFWEEDDKDGSERMSK